jgi:hypothetical protein
VYRILLPSSVCFVKTSTWVCPEHQVTIVYHRKAKVELNVVYVCVCVCTVSSSRKPTNGSMTSSYSSPGFDADMADMRAANNYRDDGRRFKQLDSLSTTSSSLLTRRK